MAWPGDGRFRKRSRAGPTARSAAVSPAGKTEASPSLPKALTATISRTGWHGTATVPPAGTAIPLPTSVMVAMLSVTSV